MPRKKIVQREGEGFGRRLAKLREEAGLSQKALGALVGLSPRMVAYYEGRSALPPGHVLAALGEAFGVSADELMGAKPTRAKPLHRNQRLWRRFAQIEKLPVRDRKELFSVIDAYLDRHRLTQRAG